MKKVTLFGIIFIAALMVFSTFAPAAFAGNSTHKITIVNNSDTPLKPANNPHVVVYNSDKSECASVPPDACGQVNLTPSDIPARSSGVVNMTGPTGCNISMWQIFYQPATKGGKKGNIVCSKSPVNLCSSVSKDYTCTISQANVDTANNGSNSPGTVQ